MLAAASVRSPQEVRVYSRSADNRVAFGREIAPKLSCPLRLEDSVERAVRDADIVLCATSSRTPVLDAAWLKPDAHINTVGPKICSGHELGIDVAERSAVIATDSPVQMHAYSEPLFLDGTPHMRRVADLAEIVVTPRRQQRPGMSLGLSGTEILAAAYFLGLAKG